MNKPRKPKKRRHVYPYICRQCLKRRLAFVYARAKKRLCTLCEEKNYVDENQATIFD